MKRKIQRELPKAGTILKGKFKGVEYNAKVVNDENLPEGKGIKFNGEIYKSMTAAATAITRQPVNGWRFWKF